MARSSFGPDRDRVLAADASAVWIDESLRVETDLDQHCAALRSALARPPGPEQDRELDALLAEGPELVPEEPYADWAMAARDALSELRREARRALARARASGQTGAGPLAIAEAWRACLAADAADEEAAQGLMCLYLSQGQRDLAIRTFHRCRAALRDELGVHPGPDLVRLHEAALASGAQVRPADQRVATGTTRRPQLHGRGVLLTRLLRLLTSGDKVSVLITGPAGIGKTRLLEVLSLALGERGWAVVGATAAAEDFRVPQSAIRKLLAQIVSEQGVSAPESLRTVMDPVTGAGIGPASGSLLSAHQLAAEARSLLDGAAAAMPLAIVLDDAHWWDRGTHRLIAELAEPRPSARWALVVAARTGEARSRVPQLPSGVVRIELAPLSQAAIEAVVSDVTHRRRLPRSARSAIAARSGGNPFFAVELARQALTDRTLELSAPPPVRVPARIVELLDARLQRCSRSARQMLRLVALAGDSATYELLVNVGHATRPAPTSDEVIHALDELVAADLLVEGPSTVRLVHPLLLDAAVAGLNPLRRAALHAQIAEALERMGPGPGGGWQEAAARHRLYAFEAGRLREMAPAAARSGFAAGHRARALLTREAAVDLLQGARAAFDVLDGGEREELRSAAVAGAAELGDSLLDGDDDDGAAAAYRWGLELAATDDEYGRLWSALGGIQYRHGDMAAAAVAYQRGLASTASDRSAGRARLLSDLGWARQRQGRYQEALPLYLQALPVLDSTGEQTYLAWTLDRLAVALVSAGRLEEALQASSSAFEAGAKAGMRAPLASLHIHRANVFEAMGQLDDALAQTREAIRIARESGDRYLEAVAHWESADVLAALGDAEAALTERDTELHILGALDNPRNLAGNQLHRAQLLAQLGRVAEARAAAAAARQAGLRTADPRLSKHVESVLSGLQQSLLAPASAG